MKTAKQILIIEDEKSLARALEIKLSNAGFRVKVVFNGEEAIEFLQKQSFDLILLDLIMPKMDGFTLLAILKIEKIKTPVMVLSNLSQEQDEKRAKEFGAREFFVKSNTPLATVALRAMELLR